MTKTKTDRWRIDELAGILGVGKLFEDMLDWQPGCYKAVYEQTYDEVLEEGATGDEAVAAAEEAATKAEDEERDETYRKLVNGFEVMLSRVAQDSGVRFVQQKNGLYRAEAVDSWRETLEKVRQIVNGVGYFHYSSRREMLAVGPYSTDRAAVLAHLGWIKDYPKVYGDRRYVDTIYSYLR